MLFSCPNKESGPILLLLILKAKIMRNPKKIKLAGKFRSFCGKSENLIFMGKFNFHGKKGKFLRKIRKILFFN